MKIPTNNLIPQLGRALSPKAPGHCRNLWPAAIIASFVIFICGTAGLIVMAATQKVDLVSPDYYAQEIRFQQRIDSVNRAQQLSQRPTIRYQPALHRLNISMAPITSASQITGTIQLYRPSVARLDQQFNLQLDATGHQSLDASHLDPGLWKVRLSWQADGQDYFLEQRMLMGTPNPPRANSNIE